MDLKLSYDSYKSLLGALKVYYAPKADGSLKLWAFPAWGDTNYCTTDDPADIADFDATLKPTATQVADEDEAAAIDSHATGGRRAVKDQPFTKAGRQFIVTGARFVCPLGAATPCDTSFAEERELQGARLCVRNGSDGDFVNFEVVHPQAGVVLVWAQTIYVKPGEGIRDEYITGDSKTLPAGLILRMTYHSVGTTGDAPIVYLDFLGWR
jgi:hypothetical protein